MSLGCCDMTMRLFSFKLNMAFLPAKYESAKNLNKTVDFGWLRSEICEPFKTPRKTRRENLRAIQNSAKNSAKVRERKAQDGNNLRRNWFIGGCPISWRRPTLPHSHAVPSARTGLTALFGMGRGVPRGYNRHCLLKFLAYSTHINAL